MISGLVSRPWCLMEICSRQEIINIVTDPSTETTKIGLCFDLHYCEYASIPHVYRPNITILFSLVCTILTQIGVFQEWKLDITAACG